MPGTLHARTRVQGRSWTQLTHRPPGRPARGALQSPTIASVQRLQKDAGNRAVARMLAGGCRKGLVVQRDDHGPAGGVAAEPTLPEAIGFIGLNPLAWKEAKAIKSPKGQAARRVIAGLEDKEFAASLATDAGIAQWLVSAGIHPLARMGTFLAASNLLQNVEPAARDTVAQMITMFDGAQRGTYRLSRLVMSGHSNGLELWGEAQADGSGGGTLILDRELAALAAAFPVAAAQVRAVMFSACYSVRAIDLCARIFPNLAGAWAYAKFSPSVKQGSARHIDLFIRESAGGKKKLDRGDARGSSALWTRESGFIVNDPAKADPRALLSQVGAIVRGINGIYSGETTYNKGFLDASYGLLQEFVAHPRAATDQKAIAQEWIPIVLRLRYWSLVRERFATAYRTQIDAAYDELAWPQPDWKNVTRTEVADEKRAFEGVGNSTPKAKAFGDGPLTKGLYRLDAAFVPTTWI